MACRTFFQIPTQKIDIKAESKIGSMDNVKHKPGGGEKKIFNDRDYLRQTSSNVESLNGSGSQVCVQNIKSFENNFVTKFFPTFARDGRSDVFLTIFGGTHRDNEKF